MPRDLLVYVAGPLGKEEAWPANVKRAIDTASCILDAHPRLNVIVPHLATVMHAVHPRDYEQWMAIDFGHILRCDAVYRIEGVSPGADREVAHALENGIPVFSCLSQLLTWVEGCP